MKVDTFDENLSNPPSFHSQNIHFHGCEMHGWISKLVVLDDYYKHHLNFNSLA